VVAVRPSRVRYFAGLQDCGNGAGGSELR
jgi:hypothetical protein